MRKTLILGSTSAIAQETAKWLAAEGGELFLVARDPAKLQSVAQDLQVRGARYVGTFVCDLNHFDQHELILKKAAEALGEVNTVLIAHGTLGNQKVCESSTIETLQELKTNFLSIISLLTLVSNQFEQQGSGCIAVIASVAGDRGRKSNYVYGTAKGGVTIFLSGLRARLYKSGVNIITIKPGFVDSPMTARFNKGLLWASPATVGKAIYHAIVKGRDVIYSPWYWAWIMFVIKMLPESFFKRISL